MYSPRNKQRPPVDAAPPRVPPIFPPPPPAVSPSSRRRSSPHFPTSSTSSSAMFSSPKKYRDGSSESYRYYENKRRNIIDNHSYKPFKNHDKCSYDAGGYLTEQRRMPSGGRDVGRAYTAIRSTDTSSSEKINPMKKNRTDYFDNQRKLNSSPFVPQGAPSLPVPSSSSTSSRRPREFYHPYGEKVFNVLPRGAEGRPSPQSSSTYSPYAHRSFAVPSRGIPPRYNSSYRNSGRLNNDDDERHIPPPGYSGATNTAFPPPFISRCTPLSASCAAPPSAPHLSPVTVSPPDRYPYSIYNNNNMNANSNRLPFPLPDTGRSNREMLRGGGGGMACNSVNLKHMAASRIIEEAKERGYGPRDKPLAPPKINERKDLCDTFHGAQLSIAGGGGGGRPPRDEIRIARVRGGEENAVPLMRRDRNSSAPKKDIPCKFFPIGDCHMGTECPYSHAEPVGKAELNHFSGSADRLPPFYPMRKTVPCRHWEKGLCWRGEACLFAHSGTDVRSRR